MFEWIIRRDCESASADEWARVLTVDGFQAIDGLEPATTHAAFYFDAAVIHGFQAIDGLESATTHAAFYFHGKSPFLAIDLGL